HHLTLYWLNLARIGQDTLGSLRSPADQNQTLSLLAHQAPARNATLHNNHTTHQGITSPPSMYDKLNHNDSLFCGVRSPYEPCVLCSISPLAREAGSFAQHIYFAYRVLVPKRLALLRS